MKHLHMIALILLLGVLQPAVGQITHSAAGQQDRQATDLMQRAARQFDQNVAFEVEVTMLDGQQKEQLRQTASVLYNKGSYHVRLDDIEVFCDSRTVWQWNKANHEVMIENATSGDIDLNNPATLLRDYAKLFRAKYIRTESDGTAIVDLQPLSAQNYHKIRLFVAEKTAVLQRMEVYRYDSSREVYRLRGFKKANTPAAKFVFDPTRHPDTEVIDMR